MFSPVSNGDVDMFTFADSSNGSLNFDGVGKYTLPWSMSMALESWVSVDIEQYLYNVRFKVVPRCK